jgi:hypothetical protein
VNQPKQYAGSMAQPSSDHSGSDNLLDLIRQLTSQGTHLAEQQLALVKAEVRESAADVKTAVGGMLGAAVVGIAGLGVVLMGLAFLLGDAIENTPLATLIVGLVTLLVAYLLYAGAKKKMNAAHLTPDRTRETLERTPAAVRGELTPEQQS